LSLLKAAGLAIALSVVAKLLHGPFPVRVEAAQTSSAPVCTYQLFFASFGIADAGGITSTSPSMRTSSSSPPCGVPTDLVPNVPPGQPVGATITWTAVATDNLPLEYRFSVAEQGQPSVLVRDYEPANSFTWTPIEEGAYTVQVSVREAPPSSQPPS